METVIDSKMDPAASKNQLSQTLKMCKSFPNP